MVVPIGIRAHDDASRVAREIVMRWRHIDAALAPIVGSLGVATLYRRCLFLTGKTYPWLVPGGGRPATRRRSICRRCKRCWQAATAPRQRPPASCCWRPSRS